MDHSKNRRNDERLDFDIIDDDNDDLNNKTNNSNNTTSFYLRQHQDIINDIFQSKFKRIGNTELDVIGLFYYIYIFFNFHFHDFCKFTTFL